MTQSRKPYPSDVSDEEWALVAPYLALLPEESGQRVHALREVFNGLRYIVKTGAPWRWMPSHLVISHIPEERVTELAETLQTLASSSSEVSANAHGRTGDR
jgi:transposase